MRFQVATLCDFVQIRDGLGFVASAGINRIRRPEFPSQLGVMLALAVEVSAAEALEPFEFRVAVETEDGVKVDELLGAIEVNQPIANGEHKQLWVPVDLRAVPLDQSGRYAVRATLPMADQQLADSVILPFTAESPPT